MTKTQINNAITKIAETFNDNDRRAYIGILLNNITLPELVRMVVYKLFLNEFKVDDNPEYKVAYETLHEYAIIMDKKGFIEFDKE